MKKANSWLALIFHSAVAWIVVTWARHYIHEPDIWWHLAHGRFMVENHVFLRRDVFSHTLPGMSWINFEWLSEILAFLLYRATGLTGFYLAKVILSVTAVAAVVLAARKSGARGPLLVLLFWGAFHLLQPRLCTRIELVSLNMMGVFLLLLLWADHSLEDRRTQYLPWVFASLTIFWCNLHAGFIYGFGLLVAFEVGARWAHEDPRFIDLLDRSLVWSLLGLILNPFGPRLLKVFYQHAHDFHSYSPQFLEEWAKPTLSSTPYFWGAGALVIILAIDGIRRKDRGVHFWIPSLLMFGVYGTRYYRSTVLFSFVAVPFFAYMLSRRENNIFSSLNEPRSPFWWILCVFPLLIDGQFFTKKLPQGLVDTDSYPVGACRFIDEKNIDGKMYNPLGFGGYIDWALGPRRKVFEDGRYIFYPIYVEQQEIEAKPETLFSEQSWHEYFDKYGVDYAVTRYEEPAFQSEEQFLKFRSNLTFQFPHREWALVYWDDSSLVFLKRIEKFRPLIQSREYKTLEPYGIGHMIVLSRSDKDFKLKLLSELKRAVSECGWTERAKQMASSL